jgi:hypothetical protein
VSVMVYGLVEGDQGLFRKRPLPAYEKSPNSIPQPRKVKVGCVWRTTSPKYCVVKINVPPPSEGIPPFF